jgi:hypothetical protein
MDSEATSALLFECGICMDSKTTECINFLPCIHFICTDCHNKLIKNECPFCRNIISEEEYSFDETENEYNDVQFEMLVMEEDRRSRRKTKKFKKQEKRIIKLMQNNKEVFVTINHNTFRVLSNITDI